MACPVGRWMRRSTALLMTLRSSVTTVAPPCSGITSPASPPLTSRREWSRGAGPSSSAMPGRSPRSSSASACRDLCWWRSGARRRALAATSARIRPIARSLHSPTIAGARNVSAPSLSTPSPLLTGGLSRSRTLCGGPGRARLARRSSCLRPISCTRRRPTDRGRRTSSTIPPTRSRLPRLSSKGMAGSQARAGTKASPTSPPSCNGTRPRFTPEQLRYSPTGSRGRRGRGSGLPQCNWVEPAARRFAPRDDGSIRTPHAPRARGGAELQLLPALLLGFPHASRRHRVLGDHEFLVGRDHEDHRRRILGADDLRIGAVRLAVEMDAHPFHVLEDSFAHFPRVFADAGCEHDRLGAVDRRRKAGEFASNAGDKISDGVARRRAGGRLELAHILRQTRHALEPRVLP